ncbi:ABC transporter substrate-binding protein [Gemmobacter nectariphilus]|uniref:ABC transporter substrate-binding protein n=1 Tax=Gemmobacter nectariphilus TaxID=220343 RepID=UPI00041201BA|nr:ABC transporter substrate-binding protein [Gemmobacter nectariphilus]
MITRRIALGLATALGLTLTALPGLAADPLKVGSYPANPPWETKTESGKFEGFEVDIATEIAKRLGTTVTIEGYDFTALFPATASKRIDMAISSLTITDERLGSQSFTQPYIEGALGLATKSGSGIAKVADIKGRTVGTVATTFAEKWLTERKDELGFKELKTYTTTANMLTDILTGRLDAALNDVVGLRYAATQMKGLDVPDEIVTGERFAIMMTKNHPQLGAVNDAISAMKTDGTMTAIFRKWFGVDPAAGSLTLTPLPVPTSASN